MREYRQRQKYKAPKQVARVNIKPPASRIQWTPAKLADAEVYVRMNAGRFQWRPCLGPPDVPAHDHFGAENDRICPKCSALLTDRNAGRCADAVSCTAPG
jgi:hypothetical protein